MSCNVPIIMMFLGDNIRKMQQNDYTILVFLMSFFMFLFPHSWKRLLVGFKLLILLVLHETLTCVYAVFSVTRGS